VTAAVTVEHLRRLATVDPRSLFRDADTLVDSDEGITIVPFRLVTEALEGRGGFVHRLLYHRSALAENGIQAGAHPRTLDGSDLDERLAGIAAGINEALADTETIQTPEGDR
jgi:hypothetical protein